MLRKRKRSIVARENTAREVTIVKNLSQGCHPGSGALKDGQPPGLADEITYLGQEVLLQRR